MRPYINAISHYLPEFKLTNEMLNQAHPEWAVDKIALKTGISERPIAAGDEFASDMAVKAAEKLFAANHFDRKKIDYLLLCTQSPDHLLPTTACLLQHRLSLSKHCGALDFNLGCSGFIYGIGLAKGLLATGQAKNVLLITSETYSKYIHPDDKSNKTLFGDAAAATLISCDENDRVNETVGYIGDFIYGTDGSGGEHLIVRNGASRYQKACIATEQPYDENGSNGDYLFMNGKAIFEFTAFSIPDLINDLLAKHNLSMNELDLFVFHQANKFMLDTIRKRSRIPEEKFFIHIDKCANTVSSTIPIALQAGMEQKRIGENMKVMITGFGVGLSLGGTILTYQ